MARSTIDFADAVEKILEEFGDEVKDRMDEVVDKLAQKAAKQLRATSPVDEGSPKSGSYAKGWRVEKNDKAGHSRLTSTAIVYNKEPGLPHLLEHGHALRQGGRSPAIAHIKPVEDMLYKSFRPEELLK